LEPSLFLYNLLLETAGYAAARALISRSPGEQAFRKGRWGDYGDSGSRDARSGGPRIWLHAASVGELSGALPTLQGLTGAWPDAAVTLTVGTWQGYRSARARAPKSVAVLPFPLDFRWVLQKAFQRIRPDFYVALESEFWPNLASSLRESRVPSVLLNGRVTRRSLERYTLLKPLFRPIFQQFEWLAMHSEEDRLNAVELGARPERTVALGSSKYEGLASRVDQARVAHWRQVLRLPEDAVTVVGGSLRRSECTDLLDVFRELARTGPGLVGLFVPRHLERIPGMARWLEERGAPFQLLSRIESGVEARREAVVLVDRIGILFDLYGLGDLIFCGGTLEPIGGHNILEPAAWSKTVFYGPHTQKVRHEHLTLQTFGGSFEVRDARELLKAWRRWLNDRDGLRQAGKRAGDALQSMGGVVDRQIALIRGVLEENRRTSGAMSAF
jgi:3-deoxy-D-manno-octulosonic-acid transferase